MRAEAITNFIMVVVLLINAILTAKGKNPIPFDESEISEAIAYIASIVMAIWAWWKNNNITAASQTGQLVVDEMKAMKNDPDGTGDPEGEAPESACEGGEDDDRI